MKKTTTPDPWKAYHKPKSVAEIASFLELTPARVRQVITELKHEAVDRIGNVPFYEHFTVLKIQNRNTKPGPRGKR